MSPEKATPGAIAARNQLAKYELLKLLGVGGMAEVHLARTKGPHGLGRLVVVKRLLAPLAQDPQFARMFVDEARIALLLNHPNIVQVHDVDEVDGAVFYVMEFLEGRDVRAIVRRARETGTQVPLDAALSIVSAMCAGLHYAHELTNEHGEPLQVVHRDVSPHNVFVRSDGVVKVIDFGIAKAENRLTDTATGMLKGKFGYMSPEQCLKQPIDRRSDVFCISVILYELTTGTRLYDGTSEYEMVKKLVEADAPRPSTVRPDYPIELECIVMRGLERDRTGRHSTAAELQAELAGFAAQRGLDISARPIRAFLEQLGGDDEKRSGVLRPASGPPRPSVVDKTGPAAASRITQTASEARTSEPPVLSAAASPPAKRTRLGWPILVASILAAMALFWWARARSGQAGGTVATSSPATVDSVSTVDSATAGVEVVVPQPASSPSPSASNPVPSAAPSASAAAAKPPSRPRTSRPSVPTGSGALPPRRPDRNSALPY